MLKFVMLSDKVMLFALQYFNFYAVGHVYNLCIACGFIYSYIKNGYYNNDEDHLLMPVLRT